MKMLRIASALLVILLFLMLVSCAQDSVTTITTTVAQTSASVKPAVSPTPAVTTPETTLPMTIAPTTAPPTPTPGRTAAQMHADAIVIDTHCDTLLEVLDADSWLPVNNLGRKTSFDIDIAKLKTGGMDAQVFASYTTGYMLAGSGQDFTKSNSRLLALINGLKWTLANNSSTIRQVYALNDITNVGSGGQTQIIASIEGAYSLSETNGLELLRQYDDLGIRMLAPVWNNSNALGEGVSNAYVDGTATSGGLTDLGRSVIAEMNRLGMVVDVSHMNEATFWEAMAATSSPVVASHSCAYTLKHHARNLKDDQIRAIAENGGVVQVNFYRTFLTSSKTVTVKTVVDHIDYIVKLVGIEHVGLGSDFDGASMPDGLTNASLMPNITAELVSRGYSENDIRKILGGNTIRVFNAVWARATATGSSAHAPTFSMMGGMGATVESATPLLSATVMADTGYTLDPSSLAVVVDGLVSTPTFDAATGLVSFTPATPLLDKFHVVTFTAANTSGETARETRIFYIP